MKKEARLLRGKAIDSLTLAIGHFNSPCDQGRAAAVLILLDHALEMLLKAAIVHKGGRIRERRAKETFGFDACVRKGLSDAKIVFLVPEQALSLQSVNTLRDAAQHHLLDISEEHLYLQAVMGVTVFRDIYESVFLEPLADSLPNRVLPVSTTPPKDLLTLFEDEVEAIRTLLRPGTRRRTEASAKLRALAIVDGALQGERLQPGEGELRKLASQVRTGEPWDTVFPGVASIKLTAHGHGPSLDLRFTKKDGIPIHTVEEGTPGATVVGVKKVNELDFYTLSTTRLAAKVGLTLPKTTAVIWYLNLKRDPECAKEIKIDTQRFWRYSPKAISRVRQALTQVPAEEMWERYKRRCTERTTDRDA